MLCPGFLSVSTIGGDGHSTIPSPGRSLKQFLPGIGLHNPLHGRQAYSEFNSFHEGFGQTSPREELFSCRSLPRRGQICDIPAPPQLLYYSFTVVRSEGHSWLTHIITHSWLMTAISNFTVRFLTHSRNWRPLRMIYKDCFHHATISSSPKSRSLIDYTLVVEILSSGSASKMLVVKRSLETTSPK